VGSKLWRRQHDKKGFLDMPAITFVAPILANREEEWRRFIQEVLEEHLHEYEEFRRRLGISNESVWLARTKRGETALVHLEAKDPERIVPALTVSERPFDLWLKERLLECHGDEIVRVPSRVAAKLVFAYQDILKDYSSFHRGSSL
jgi:hypothetical protein